MTLALKFKYYSSLYSPCYQWTSTGADCGHTLRRTKLHAHCRAISAYLCDYISTYLVFCKLSTYIARLNVSSAHKGDSPALCFSTKKQKSRITSRGIISHQQLILKRPLPPRVSGAKHPFITCEALLLVLLKMINHLRNIFIFETMI